MKYLLRVVLIVFTIQTASSQIVFCPAGAKWNYSFVTYFLYYTISNEKISYVKDSVMGTDTVKLLQHNKYYSYLNFDPNTGTLIKQTGDTVFFRNSITQHAWQILYNFAATAGQSWTTAIGPVNGNLSQTYTITVDSVRNVMVNSFSLRRLYVKYTRPNFAYDFPTQITERFGSLPFMFIYRNPANWTDGDQVQELLCYEDSTFGLKQFTNKPCNYIDYVGLNENSGNASGIVIYPNPGQGLFHLTGLNNNTDGFTLSVTDIVGREVKWLELENGLEEYTIDLRDLAKGTYLAILKRNNTLVYANKLIKQD